MQKTAFFLFLLFTGLTSACAQQKTQPKEDFSDDWAALSHYAAENKSVPAPAAGEKRVVFLGSSIFEFWKEKVPGYFAGKPYYDRGISGQIAPQLLIRFRQDVIGLKPKAVIILAGSNDLAGDHGHVTVPRIMDNIRSMCELAKANNIRVILSLYLPISQYPWRKELDAVEGIRSLNTAIRAYAEAEKLAILDYFTPLADDKNGQKKAFTTDGVHPNAAGYAVMAKVTDEAIARVLGE